MQRTPNSWTIISAIAAVLALVIPIGLFMFSRERKALTIETVSSASVADLRDPGLSVLKLAYKDQPISQVTTATIAVSNTGTQPIEIRDFERPLVIKFSGPDSTLAVTLSEREPSNLMPEVTLGSSDVTISPLLLNPGDQFRLNIVLRGDFTEPLVDARLAGVRGVSPTMLKKERRGFPAIIMLIVGVAAISAYAYLGLFANPLGGRRIVLLPTWDALACVVIIAVAGAVLFVLALRSYDPSNRSLILMITIVIVIMVMLVAIVRRNRVLRNNLNERLTLQRNKSQH